MQFEDTIEIRGVMITRQEPGAGVNSVDRYSPLRQRGMRLRGSHLLLLGILVAPLVMLGYAGLMVLLILPLLGLRRMFPRRSTSSLIRWESNTPLDSGRGKRVERGDKESMTMTRLFVGNLSSEVTQSDLREAFVAYGPVRAADVVMDRSNGRSKNVGFIEMPWQAHAVAAIKGLDGTDLKGRSINVSRARPRGDGGSRGNPPPGWEVAGDGWHHWQ